VRVLILIPAHNEADSLVTVVEELRAAASDLDVLVIDDASTDRTAALLPRLGVRWIEMSQHVGTGTAVRTGLRYAVWRGYDAAVRIDGDGQHPAEEIARLLDPIRRGEADAVIGSRYLDGQPTSTPLLRRLSHRALAGVMSVVTGQLVTDPTSGLWAFDRRALRLLVEHHPSGYPEPELRLFLSRNAMRVTEVPVVMRNRIGGQSSLTPLRMGAAVARLLLLLLIVPLRSAVRSRHD
jgi:glycosyltransferase involved in cell wall biosynthesis